MPERRVSDNDPPTGRSGRYRKICGCDGRDRCCSRGRILAKCVKNGGADRGNLYKKEIIVTRNSAQSGARERTAMHYILRRVGGLAPRLRALKSDQRGAMAVLTAISATAVVGLAGLAVDVGYWQMQ